MSKSDWSPIEKTVLENLKHSFPGVTPTFVLAVSGGMDSMSLLHAFKRLGISAIVSHINYQKRGTASEKDAHLVAQQASKWEFDSHFTTLDPTEARDKNFQQWARNKRYNIFDALAEEHNADGIAVAHHEDDQVETILQKMFRGAGLASWSGMQIWDGRIFRPLLDISRAQIKEYVTEFNIPYRTDESNLDSEFARNLLRNEWLDKLSEYFPGWKKNVLRIPSQAGHFERALGWIAQQLSDRQGIHREEFNALEPDLKKSVLLYLLKQQDAEISISRDSLKRVDELESLQTGKAIQLSPGLSIWRDRKHYVIEAQTIESFQAVQLKRDQLEFSPFQLEGLDIKVRPYREPNFNQNLYLDVAKLSWPVRIRRWQPGDQFQPLGMEGHQQVSDHLTNRKISAAYKKEALVIESFEETICAIIFPPIKNQIPPGTISDQVKCGDETTQCLEIKYRS